MSAFDKIIGYNNDKKALVRICDMIHNKDLYRNLGAKMPRGLLLYGDPGLGKTLMAECFIEESRLPCYTLRRNRSSDDFIKTITETFEKAKENAPSIVFLDDMDKFANEDDRHRDAEEYVAIQSGIDAVKHSNIFVLATANDIDKLPDSLIRAGRFDRQIGISSPSPSDTESIIKHYLENKKLSDNINFEDIAKMLSFNSCAELETISNEAAINAAFSRRNAISMQDMVDAILKTNYDIYPYSEISEEEIRENALHEAGHLVMSEVLSEGSVGLASIDLEDDFGKMGLVRNCKDLNRRPYIILVALAGKAAVELYYSEKVAGGCESDLRKAHRCLVSAITDNATLGLSLLEIPSFLSQNYRSTAENTIHAELERYMLKARDILIKNRAFLEMTTDALISKKTLLYSDIKQLRESSTIVKVAV